MVRRRWILSVCAVFLIGCGQASEIPYDETENNLVATGLFGGVDLDIHEVQDYEAYIGGEREYFTVGVNGEKDFSKAAFCKMGAKVATADWEFGIALEHPDLADLQPGTYDLSTGPLRVSAEFELRLQTPIERIATGGLLEIKALDHESTHPDNDHLYEGGHVGCVFSLEFSSGESVQGSLFAAFGLTEVDVSENGQCE